MNPTSVYSSLFPFLIVIGLLPITTPSFSQNQAYIDSILNVVDSYEGMEQIACYRRLVKATLRSNPEVAKEYIDSSRVIAERIRDIEMIASTTGDYAVYLNYTGDYEGALLEYEKALKILIEIGEKNQTSLTLNNKALALNSLGRRREALETHIKSLKIKEELKLENYDDMGDDYWDESIAASYWNIGNLQGDLQKYEKSNEYYYQAIEIYDRLGLIDDVEQVKENVAINLAGLEKYSEAIALYKKNIEYLRTTRYYTPLATTYGNLTKAYLKTDSLALAKQTLKKAIDLKNEHNDITLTGLHTRYEGDIWMKEKKYRAALSNYKEALAIATDAGAKPSILMGYRKVSDAYATLGNYKKSHEYLNLYMELNEEISNSKNIANINELEILYQSERKEKDLIIEKEKVTTLEKEAAVSSLQRWLLALGLLIALLSLAFGWYSYRQKSKLAQKEKEKLDAELEFKKKELTTYALHLAKKNEMLEGLKSKAKELRNESEEKNGYRQLIRTIDFDLEDDNNWDNFANYFQQVHKDFNHNVSQKFPEVTPNDLRIISLVKMNLSVKEMANILNISVAGVKKSRQRLRKKMNLSTNDSLEKAVLSI